MNWVGLRTTIPCVRLYSGWFALRIVTMEFPLNPWLPLVVTVATVPLRTIDWTGTVTVDPKEAAAILLLLVAKSLSWCVRSFWHKAGALPSGQKVYTRRGLSGLPLLSSNVAVRFCLRNCCATPPFSTTSPSPCGSVAVGRG